LANTVRPTGCWPTPFGQQAPLSQERRRPAGARLLLAARPPRLQFVAVSRKLLLPFLALALRLQLFKRRFYWLCVNSIRIAKDKIDAPLSLSLCLFYITGQKRTAGMPRLFGTWTEFDKSRFWY